MHKSKSVFLILLSLIMLLSACGTPAQVEPPETTTDSVVVETEATTIPTEAEIVPEETAPIPIAKAEFVLETVDGQEQYTMSGFSYPAHLGAPKLGMEGVAALYQEGDFEKAVDVIGNVADAVHYMMDMAPFMDSLEACNTFVQLLTEKFHDVGTITLRGRDFMYSLAYINEDSIYYPIDIYNLANGWASWIMLPENGCEPSGDAYSLCENIAASFPGQTVIESWIMDNTWLANPDNPTKYPFPWELAGSDLTQEEIAQLLEAGDQYAADRAITTVEDAITYLLMMDPKTRDPHPMKGRPAWKTFLYLIADDYEDVGLINLMKRKPEHREGFYDQSAYFGNYLICYVKKDGIYYPVDYFNILDNWTSWTLLPNNACYSSENLDALCERMGATFPYHADGSKQVYWEITSYMYHQGTKMIPVSEFVIPEGLGHPVLSDAEIEALTQETDYALIAEKITTLADALRFYDKLRLVQPNGSSSFGHPGLEYFSSAWQALKDKKADATTTCSLTHYLLNGDYDDVGYVLTYATSVGTSMMYIYEDGLYYLLYASVYSTDPREDLWMEWPGVIGCAADFQTIADTLVEHAWALAPGLSERTKSVYLIRSDGDFVFCRPHDKIFRFPTGTEVITYYGTEPLYEDATKDWQSQTRIDH